MRIFFTFIFLFIYFIILSTHVNISDELRTKNVELMYTEKNVFFCDNTEKNVHTGTKYNSIQALFEVKLEIHVVGLKAACQRTYN